MPDQINEKDLIFISGCFCCNQGLYTDMPDCIGCSAEREFICCHDACCLKSGGKPYGPGLNTEPGDNQNICELQLYFCQCGYNKPNTCCKAQQQVLCCVGSAALPPVDEIPMMCGLCFVALYPKVGVFKKQGEILG